MLSEDWEYFLSDPFDPPCQETNLISEEYSENNKNAPVRICCFDCLGEVDVQKIELNGSGYFKSNDNLFSTSSVSISSIHESKYGMVSLFNRSWDKGSSFYKHLDLFFKMASKEIMILEQGASIGVSVFENNTLWNSNCNKNFKDSRFYCLDFLLHLQNCITLLCSNDKYMWMLKELYPTIKKKLQALRKHLGHLINLPDYVHAHTANSNGNKSMQASYHLIHLHLDIRWHYLLLLYKLFITNKLFRNYKEHASLSSDELVINENRTGIDDSVINEIQFLVLELLELSLKRFEKIGIFNLRKKSPFSCTCIQELWMLIICMTNKLHSCNQGKPFWDVVGSYLDISVIQDSHPSEILKFFQLNQINFSIFSLWVLCNIARLDKYVIKDSEDNYCLLDSNLKYLFSKDISEANTRTILAIIEILCLEIWEPKPETMLILWEHFHKKMNTNFYIPGAPPASLAVVSKTPKSFITQLKSYLEDLNNISDSFQHFLRIIGLHLQKSQKIPRHWNLLKGRLYSKLTLSKLESLSNIGEYHFISLYIMLAISQDIRQIELKMVEIITSYFNKKKYLSEQLLKGQLGLVLLILENEGDASAALQPVSEYIKSLSIVENVNIFRLYVETFQDILSLNVPLNLGQHLLIDKWISDYLTASSETDVSRLLDTIVLLLNRLKTYCDFESPEQSTIMMIEKLWDQLKNYLESSNLQQETPHQISGIAANLAIISLQVQNKERLIEIVNMFAFQGITDISVLRQFVCLISQNERISAVMTNFDKFVIKTWVKCCFLCSDMDHCEMKDLTKNIIRLPEMTNLLGEDASKLAYSNEPFFDFICSLHKKYAVEETWGKQVLRDKVSVYLEGLEKWIRPIVVNPRDIGKILSLYKTVGHMIRLISPIIYCKSKPNTLLQQLIDLFLLPMSMRNPDTKLHPSILAAIKASLHMFIEGLIFLDPESDHYILRVLKELILVYLPQCMNSNNQNVLNYGSFALISSFANFDNSSRQLILNLISSAFLKRKARNPHPYAVFALKFVKELLKDHKTNEGILVCIVENMLENVFDVLMYSEDKSFVTSLAKEIMNLIFNNDLLRASNRATIGVMKILSALCQENLAWYSRQLFDLLVLMTSIAPDLVRRFTPTLLEQVQQVESKRGVGYDRTLRLGIERIEINLRTIKDVT